MDVAVWVLAVVVVVALGARGLLQRSPRRRGRAQVRALRVACKGDQELVERLIFAEMQRGGDLDYVEAARRALARLERDRR